MLHNAFLVGPLVTISPNLAVRIPLQSSIIKLFHFSVPTERVKRKIPNYFTCEKVIGTNCTYRTRIEAAFREHILTHVAEKLKDQLVS